MSSGKTAMTVTLSPMSAQCTLYTPLGYYTHSLQPDDVQDGGESPKARSVNTVFLQAQHPHTMMIAAPRTPSDIACVKRKLLKANLPHERKHQHDCGRFWIAEVNVKSLSDNFNVANLSTVTAITCTTQHNLMALPLDCVPLP